MKLGDVIEDWCPRCRLLLDHGVAALDGDDVKKVICRTCHSEHPYRAGRGSRREEQVKELFENVLKRRTNGDDPEKKPRKR